MNCPGRTDACKCTFIVLALLFCATILPIPSACTRIWRLVWRQSKSRLLSLLRPKRHGWRWHGSTQGLGYNLYGNYGVYGYPGSGIEGGASNSGYDPGYGGYPSYGGYGIANTANRNLNAATSSPRQRLLGIDEDPIVLPDGAKAMKVGKVFPDTPAARAGLQTGDVITAVNGYLTEQRGNLAWIIANASPNNELKISVHSAKDGQNHVITATLR